MQNWNQGPVLRSNVQNVITTNYIVNSNGQIYDVNNTTTSSLPRNQNQIETISNNEDCFNLQTSSYNSGDNSATVFSPTLITSSPNLACDVANSYSSDDLLICSFDPILDTQSETFQSSCYYPTTNDEQMIQHHISQDMSQQTSYCWTPQLQQYEAISPLNFDQSDSNSTPLTSSTPLSSSASNNDSFSFDENLNQNKTSSSDEHYYGIISSNKENKKERQIDFIKARNMCQVCDILYILLILQETLPESERWVYWHIKDHIFKINRKKKREVAAFYAMIRGNSNVSYENMKRTINKSSDFINLDKKDNNGVHHTFQFSSRFLSRKQNSLEKYMKDIQSHYYNFKYNNN